MNSALSGRLHLKNKTMEPQRCQGRKEIYLKKTRVPGDLRAFAVQTFHRGIREKTIEPPRHLGREEIFFRFFHYISWRPWRLRGSVVLRFFARLAP
jgi:hypothetical protein